MSNLLGRLTLGIILALIAFIGLLMASKASDTAFFVHGIILFLGSVGFIWALLCGVADTDLDVDMDPAAASPADDADASATAQTAAHTAE